MIDTEALDRLLADAVAQNSVPGVVAIVAHSTGVSHVSAHGARDVTTGAPITADAVFFAASMTKAVTAVAVLQLIERGQLTLDQPVGDVLPAFDELPVLDGFDGDIPRLRPARRRATVRHLLSHTCGLGYDTWNSDLMRYHTVAGLPNVSAGSRLVFRMPLTADPGERFQYGTGSDWAGLLIEEISGLTLDAYFRDHICGPLGMVDTDVRLDAAAAARAVPVHRQDRLGAWTVEPPTVSTEPEYWSGGHCLNTTPADFVRLQRALLCNGTLDGVRILRAASVTAMLTNQIGALAMDPMRTCNPALSADIDWHPGTRWGFGVTVSTRRLPHLRSPGSAGWSGVCNTLFWIDPAADLAAAIYTQTLPFYDPGVMKVFEAFERALYP